MKSDLECNFHDSDKMPKHVEMVRTKCQPKSWSGQNANHRQKSRTKCQPRLAFCPVGILSGWHFVHTPTSRQLTTGTHEKKMGSDDMMRYPPYQLYYDALSVSAEVRFK